MNNKNYVKRHSRVNLKSLDVLDNDSRIIRAVISSNSVDRDNEVVDIASLRVDKVNGLVDVPMQIDHEWSVEKTIGSATDIRQIDGELVADLSFAQGIPLAENTYKLLSQGHIKNAFSIGFVPTEPIIDNYLYKNAQLVEVSVVMKGANYDARVLDILKSKSLSYSELDQLLGSEGEDMNVKKDITEDVKEDIKQDESEQDTKQDGEDVSDEEEKESEENLEDESEQDTKNEENEKEEKSMKDIKEDLASVIEKAIADKFDNFRESFEVKQTPISQVDPLEKEGKEVRTFKHLKALADFDHETVRQYNKLNSKNKAYDYTTASELILCPEFDNDIKICRDELSNLVNYVKVTNLVQSDSVQRTVNQGGFQLLPVDDCGTKTATQNTFTNLIARVHEWAGISIVCDNFAEDTVISWYDQFVNDVGYETVKVENNVILSYDGSSHTGASPTGILALPGVPAVVGVYDNTLIQTLSTVACNACDCADGIYVMNKCTWGKIKAVQGLDGHGIFGTPMQIASMNDLFGKQVVVVGNSEMPDDVVIYGDFNKYELLRKGTTEILTNRWGVSQGVNLFDTDQTAFRAKIRRGGLTVFPTCFVKITIS